MFPTCYVARSSVQIMKPLTAVFSNPLIFLVLIFSSASPCQIPSVSVPPFLWRPKFLNKPDFLLRNLGHDSRCIERPVNRGSILGRGNRFFFSTKLSDRLMFPPSLLLIAYRRPFPWEQRYRGTLNLSSILHLVPSLRIYGVILARLHLPLLCGV